MLAGVRACRAARRKARAIASALLFPSTTMATSLPVSDTLIFQSDAKNGFRARCSLIHFLVQLDRIVDVGERIDLAASQNGTAAAIFLDRGHVMGDQDHVCFFAPFVEFLPAPGLEAAIPDGGDLIDEIAFEVDRHRKPEGETGAHARRIGSHRHVDRGADLGEILDEAYCSSRIVAVEAGDELDVLAASHPGMKTAPKSERPGDADRAVDATAVRQFGAR